MSIRNIATEIPEGATRIHEFGFIRLIDVMGDDSAIVEAARVSYGKGTTKLREDAKLLDYLFRNEHTGPFEMAEFKFHAKMPIFIARQWIRHRTASVNEYSGRYSEMKNHFYVPEESRIQGQDTKNKQGSDGVTVVDAQNIQDSMMAHMETSYRLYSSYIEQGVAKELARIVLPLAVYTEWYWKIDLKNLMHFLKLRMDSHAQPEIQAYANVMFKMIEPYVPHALAAFRRHQLGEDVPFPSEDDVA
ncbi:hypothetical protein LCGC14_0146090 [marine sediment metagenome]|uniref:Thymidylate synthase (FAD) n=1 Tax=marine sediment metagenome TaxID=412755 RepID=A0A0F9Y1E3_9ZZZZ